MLHRLAFAFLPIVGAPFSSDKMSHVPYDHLAIHASFKRLMLSIWLMMQIWRMIDLIYRSEEEVLEELDKFKVHLSECAS